MSPADFYSRILGCFGNDLIGSCRWHWGDSHMSYKTDFMTVHVHLTNTDMFCTVALPNGRMRVGRLEGQFENHYRWIIEPTDELLVETMLKLPYNG